MSEESDDVKKILSRMDSIEGRQTSKAWDIGIKLLVPIVLGIGASHIAHMVRIAKLEENRFTQTDGKEMEARILSNTPLPWVRDLLSEIRIDLKTLKEGQVVLSGRIREVEMKIK